MLICVTNFRAKYQTVCFLVLFLVCFLFFFISFYFGASNKCEESFYTSNNQNESKVGLPRCKIDNAGKRKTWKKTLIKI